LRAEVARLRAELEAARREDKKNTD
jgi:hypothetical protein